jgi:hypothetical protein
MPQNQYLSLGIGRAVPVRARPKEGNMATMNRTQENQGQNFKQIEGDSCLSTYLPGICAGTLMAIVLLLAISCSKKNDKAVTKVNPPSAPESTAPVSTTPAAVTPEAPKAVAKKVKKHRPASATYVNSMYGVSFSYPQKYSLEASQDKSTDNEGSFLKPGSVEIVRVDMPSDSYPDTDFSAGLFAVRIHPSLTAEECQQFGSKSSDSAKPSAVKLGTSEYSELEQINGKGQSESDGKYFHLFKNQACYEFALEVETSRSEDEDLAQVDRGKVFQQLEKILTTARIKNMELSGEENTQKSAAREMTEAQQTTEKAQVMNNQPK